jgi:hypothetical protein
VAVDLAEYWESPRVPKAASGWVALASRRAAPRAWVAEELVRLVVRSVLAPPALAEVQLPAHLERVGLAPGLPHSGE